MKKPVKRTFNLMTIKRVPGDLLAQVTGGNDKHGGGEGEGPVRGGGGGGGGGGTWSKLGDTAGGR